MKRMSKFKSVVFIVVILTIVSFCVFAQEDGRPLPPPVDIEFSVVNIPRVGEKVELRLKVTPQEDMHADIDCLLPWGIEPVREKGVMVRPYRSRQPYDIERKMRYIKTIDLWVGPLKGGLPREFSFRVVIPDKKRYQLIARVEALARWGVKEKVVVIDIE